MRAHDPASTMRTLMGWGTGLAAMLQGLTVVSDMLTPGLSPWTVGGFTCIALAHLMAAAGAIFSLPLVWPVALTTSAGLWLVASGMLWAGDPVFWHSNLWGWAILLYLVLLHPGRHWPWITMTVLGLVPMAALMPQLDWRQQVLDVAFTVVAIVIMWLAYRTMYAQIEDTERSVADEARRRSAEHRARLLETLRKEQIRLVHDTLLHLFQQVANGRGEITPEEVRRLGEESRKGLGTTDLETSPLRIALEQAVADVGCPVTLWVDDQASLPAKVTRHLADATREAVRNVARHVPGGTANVTAEVSRQGATVTISDWGPGFDPDKVPRARMGIREGIHARMAEVGGQASVRSDVVGGTEVTLTWRPIPHATRIGPSGRRWLSLIGVPGLLGTGLLLMLHPAGPNKWLAWLLYLMTSAVVVLTSRALGRRGLHRHEAFLANLWGIGVLVANFAWLTLEDTSRYDLWTIGLANALMLLTIPGRRWGESLALFLLNLIAGIAGALGVFGEVPLSVLAGSVTSLVITGVVTIALGVGTAWLGRQLQRSNQEHAEEQLTQQIRDEQAAEREAWISALDRICGPLFTGLYTGAVHPADPAVRVEARHVELRLRDALRLWPDGTHLATALDRLRRSGWECLLDVEEVESVEATRFAALLNQLDPAVAGQRLTITRRTGTLVATVAEPGLSEMRQARLRGARILLTDPDFTQFSCEVDKP